VNRNHRRRAARETRCHSIHQFSGSHGSTAGSISTVRKIESIPLSSNSGAFRSPGPFCATRTPVSNHAVLVSALAPIAGAHALNGVDPNNYGKPPLRERSAAAAPPTTRIGAPTANPAPSTHTRSTACASEYTEFALARVSLAVPIVRHRHSILWQSPVRKVGQPMQRRIKQPLANALRIGLEQLRTMPCSRQPFGEQAQRNLCMP